VTAERLWTFAVNNGGQLGRWAFIEVSDPWNAEGLIREKWLRPAEVVA